MTEPISEFYQRHYVATVSIANGKLKVLGGVEEKRRLREAKRQTSTCYVRELPAGAEIQLILERGNWVVSPCKEST